MKHAVILLAFVATTATANRPPAKAFEVAAAAPETFEQMCTRLSNGYGTIVSTRKMVDKVDGYKLEVVQDKRAKLVECFVDKQGRLTFNVKDVKKAK